MSAVTLEQMVDFALKTPEIGAVNFNVLRQLLLEMLKHLNLTSVSIPLQTFQEQFDVPQTQSNATDLHGISGAVDYQGLEKRVEDINSQLKVLNDLPTTDDILNLLKSKVDDESQLPLQQIYQFIKLEKRVAANEDCLEKMAQYMEDIMSSIVNIENNNDSLKAIISDIQHASPHETKSTMSWYALEATLKGEKSDQILGKLTSPSVAGNALMAITPKDSPMESLTTTQKQALDSDDKLSVTKPERKKEKRQSSTNDAEKLGQKNIRESKTERDDKDQKRSHKASVADAKKEGKRANKDDKPETYEETGEKEIFSGKKTEGKEISSGKKTEGKEISSGKKTEGKEAARHKKTDETKDQEKGVGEVRRKRSPSDDRKSPKLIKPSENTDEEEKKIDKRAVKVSPNVESDPKKRHKEKGERKSRPDEVVKDGKIVTDQTTDIAIKVPTDETESADGYNVDPNIPVAERKLISSDEVQSSNETEGTTSVHSSRSSTYTDQSESSRKSNVDLPSDDLLQILANLGVMSKKFDKYSKKVVEIDGAMKRNNLYSKEKNFDDIIQHLQSQQDMVNDYLFDSSPPTAQQSTPVSTAVDDRNSPQRKQKSDVATIVNRLGDLEVQLEKFVHFMLGEDKGSQSSELLTRSQPSVEHHMLSTQTSFQEKGELSKAGLNPKLEDTDKDIKGGSFNELTDLSRYAGQSDIESNEYPSNVSFSEKSAPQKTQKSQRSEKVKSTTDEELKSKHSDRSSISSIEVKDKKTSTHAFSFTMMPTKKGGLINVGEAINVKIKALYKKVLSLESQQITLMNQLGIMNAGDLGKVFDDSKKTSRTVEKVQDDLETLKEVKADKDFFGAQLDSKADKLTVDTKVNNEIFAETCNQINSVIKDIFDRLSTHEDDLRNVLTKMNNDMDFKLDRTDLNHLKTWLETRLKKLNDKIVKPAELEDEAAGVRKQLLQRFNCISCDRPIDLAPTGPLTTIPMPSGLPFIKSPRPYTTFELDQIRQHISGGLTKAAVSEMEKLASSKMGTGKRMDLKAFLVHFDDKKEIMKHLKQDIFSEACDHYATDRPCGGSHTLTHPSRRSANQNSFISQALKDNTGTVVMKRPKVEECEIIGSDGRLYYGTDDKDQRKGSKLQNGKPGKLSVERNTVVADDDALSCSTHPGSAISGQEIISSS